MSTFTDRDPRSAYWAGHRTSNVRQVFTPDSAHEDQAFVMRAPRVPPLHRTTRLAYVGALLGAAAYALFVLNPRNRGEPIPYVALFLSELILLANAIGMIWTILAGDGAAEEPVIAARRQQLLELAWQPPVDVFVTVCGEPLDIIELTLRRARDMHCAHRSIVCDDGDSPEVRELAARLGVEYISRADRTGAKAGNVNNALLHSSAEFFAIFDADHAPHPDFLIVTLPHFVRRDVAFVQSPQHYRNTNESHIAAASASAQTVFYELVCPGKNAFNSQFCVGTNVVFRRSAIDEVGGISADSHSEDIWTSIRLHRLGWSSVFVPDVLARGLAPTTVHAHLKQQYRWASGSYEILFRAKPWRMRGLTLDQRVQYLLAPLHFLLSFSIMWFLVLPPAFLLFNVHPLHTGGTTWLLRYLPFFVLTQLALFLQIGGWKPWSIAASIAAAPVQIRAFFAVLFSRNAEWNVTNRQVTLPTVLELMPVQTALLLLNLTALVVGLIVLEEPSKTALALALCAYHIVLIGAVLLEAHRDLHRVSQPRQAIIDLTDHQRMRASA